MILSYTVSSNGCGFVFFVTYQLLLGWLDMEAVGIGYFFKGFVINGGWTFLCFCVLPVAINYFNHKAVTFLSSRCNSQLILVVLKNCSCASAFQYSIHSKNTSILILITLFKCHFIWNYNIISDLWASIWTNMSFLCRN